MHCISSVTTSAAHSVDCKQGREGFYFNYRAYCHHKWAARHTGDLQMDCSVNVCNVLGSGYISDLQMDCIVLLNPQAGRPDLPPLKCIGCSNNNTAANSGLSTWGFNVCIVFASGLRTLVDCVAAHMDKCVVLRRYWRDYTVENGLVVLAHQCDVSLRFEGTVQQYHWKNEYLFPTPPHPIPG